MLDPRTDISGVSEDIAFVNSNDDYRRLARTALPVFRGYERGVTHGETYSQPNGDEFGGVAVAWLLWQLRHDEKAGRMFTGSHCGLCVNPRWATARKNIEWARLILRIRPRAFTHTYDSDSEPSGRTQIEALKAVHHAQAVRASQLAIFGQRGAAPLSDGTLALELPTIGRLRAHHLARMMRKLGQADSTRLTARWSEEAEPARGGRCRSTSCEPDCSALKRCRMKMCFHEQVRQESYASMLP